LVVARYGKRYETMEEMKLRFGIFSENLKLIKSTNRKGLSYKLAVNRKLESELTASTSFFKIIFSFLLAVGIVEFMPVIGPLRSEACKVDS
jgi:hypothetical protein